MSLIKETSIGTAQATKVRELFDDMVTQYQNDEGFIAELVELGNGKELNVCTQFAGKIDQVCKIQLISDKYTTSLYIEHL